MSETSTTLTNDDHVSLTRLLHELAWRIDHGQGAAVPDLFSSAGAFDFQEGKKGAPENVLDPTRVRDKEDMRAWAAERAQIERRTRHVLTNSRFVATGPDSASGTTVVTVYMHDGPGKGEPRPLTVGEYSDEFVRENGQWLFASRHLERLFDSAQPAGHASA